MEKRRATRVKLWADTNAIVDSKYGKIKGKIDDLGAKGMFLKTSLQNIPIGEKVFVTLVFNPNAGTPKYIPAEGKVVNRRENGIGIHFTKIDINMLYDCILELMEEKVH